MAEITLEQVARMADQLSPADKKSLVEHLTRHAKSAEAHNTASNSAEPGTRPRS